MLDVSHVIRTNPRPFRFTFTSIRQLFCNHSSGNNGRAQLSSAAPGMALTDLAIWHVSGSSDPDQTEPRRGEQHRPLPALAPNPLRWRAAREMRSRAAAPLLIVTRSVLSVSFAARNHVAVIYRRWAIRVVRRRVGIIAVAIERVSIPSVEWKPDGEADTRSPKSRTAMKDKSRSTMKTRSTAPLRARRSGECEQARHCNCTDQSLV